VLSKRELAVQDDSQIGHRTHTLENFSIENIRGNDRVERPSESESFTFIDVISQHTILAPCGQSVHIALDFQIILGTTHREIQFHVIGIKKNSYVFENLSNVIDKSDEA
jgi:hypothetical protein